MIQISSYRHVHPVFREQLYSVFLKHQLTSIDFYLPLTSRKCDSLSDNYWFLHRRYLSPSKNKTIYDMLLNRRSPSKSSYVQSTQGLEHWKMYNLCQSYAFFCWSNLFSVSGQSTRSGGESTISKEYKDLTPLFALLRGMCRLEIAEIKEKWRKRWIRRPI